MDPNTRHSIIRSTPFTSTPSITATVLDLTFKSISQSITDTFESHFGHFKILEKSELFKVFFLNHV